MYDAECLDDLYQAQYDGELDDAVILMLIDSYGNGDLNTRDLEAIGVLERDDLLDTSGKTDLDRFWLNLFASSKGKISLKRYSDYQKNATSYLYLNHQAEPTHLTFEIKKENDYIWRRRRLSISFENFDLVLGNYITAESFGLTIGRFDYRPSAGLEITESGFLFPINSYYNGVKFEINDIRPGCRFYYSKKQYDNAEKIFLGSAVDYSTENLAGGISIGFNRLVDDGIVDNRLAMGLNFRITQDDYNIAGEVTGMEKSYGFYVEAERRFNGFNFRTEFWRYGRSFYNYNCSGPSNSDYDSFYPDSLKLGFKSAQAGEIGLAVKYVKKNLSFGAMFWNGLIEEKINTSINLSAKKPLLERFDVFFMCSAKIRQENKYLWFKTGLAEVGYLLLNRTGLKFYFTDWENLASNKSYFFIDISKSLNDNFSVYLKIRNYFNGRNRLYIGEELISDKGINVIGEATFYNGTRINIRIEKLL